MGPILNNNNNNLLHKPNQMAPMVDRVSSPPNERLHLKWKGLAANLAGTLSAEVSDLGLSRSDADVLFLGNSGTSLRAHRVVLAAASDFLKSMLLEAPGEDPVTFGNYYFCLLIIYLIYKNETP